MSKIRKEIPGWKYYNHAAIPSTAPHEKINEEPIKNGDRKNRMVVCNKRSTI